MKTPLSVPPPTHSHFSFIRLSNVNEISGTVVVECLVLWLETMYLEYQYLARYFHSYTHTQIESYARALFYAQIFVKFKSLERCQVKNVRKRHAF